MPRRPMPLTPRALAFAITLAVAPGLAVAQNSADTCPLGAFTCPVVKNDFALCRKNDLLNFYEPGLPTEGDREWHVDHTVHRRGQQRQLEAIRTEGPGDVDVVGIARPPAKGSLPSSV